jgi:hypothetical protein
MQDISVDYKEIINKNLEYENIYKKIQEIIETNKLEEYFSSIKFINEESNSKLSNTSFSSSFGLNHNSIRSKSKKNSQNSTQK